MDVQVAVVLLLLGGIIAAARVGGWLAGLTGQPPVVGEIAVGLLLGPLLVHLTATTGDGGGVGLVLSGLADIGLVLFMFVIGTETHRGSAAGSRRQIAGVSALSFGLPFACGYVLVALAGLTRPEDSAAFVGLAFAVTAFPVLARILADRGLTTHPSGRLAMSSAALTDVVTWGLLVLLTASHGTGSGATVVLVVPFALLLLVVVRPALAWFAGRTGPGAEGMLLSAVGAGLVLSAGFTELIGLHYVFGAFAFGLVTPKGVTAALRTTLARKVAPVNEAIFLPTFFVLAGSHVDLGALTGASVPAALVLLAVAMASKIGGSFLGGWISGVGVRDSALVGVLMNTRGLTELIVLDVGRAAGLLTESTYSVLVVVAVVTTVATSPLIAAVRRFPGRGREPHPIDQKARQG